MISSFRLFIIELYIMAMQFFSIIIMWSNRKQLFLTLLFAFSLAQNLIKTPDFKPLNYTVPKAYASVPDWKAGPIERFYITDWKMLYPRATKNTTVLTLKNVRKQTYEQKIKVYSSYHYQFYATIMASGVSGSIGKLLSVKFKICSWNLVLALRQDVNIPTRMLLGSKYLKSTSKCSVIIEEDNLKQLDMNLHISNLELVLGNILTKITQPSAVSAPSAPSAPSVYGVSSLSSSPPPPSAPPLRQSQASDIAIGPHESLHEPNPSRFQIFRHGKQQPGKEAWLIEDKMAILKNKYFRPNDYEGPGTYSEKSMDFWKEKPDHKFQIQNLMISGYKQRRKVTALVMVFQKPKKYQQSVSIKHSGKYCFRAMVKTVGSHLRKYSSPEPIELKIEVCGNVQNYTIQRGMPHGKQIYFDYIQVQKAKCDFTLFEPMIKDAGRELLISDVELIYIPANRKLHFQVDHEIDQVDQVLLHFSSQECYTYLDLLHSTANHCPFYAELLYKARPCRIYQQIEEQIRKLVKKGQKLYGQQCEVRFTYK